MVLALILLAYAITTVAGFIFLWRRQQAQREEIAALKRTVTALETRAVAIAAPRKARRGELGVVAPVSDVQHFSAVAAPTPIGRATRAPTGTAMEPTLSPASLRLLALGIAAMLPAFALFFGVGAPAVVSFGLSMAVGMVLVGLRPDWAVATWAGLISAGVWSLLGLGLGAAQAAPIAYALPLAALGVSGLSHTFLQRTHVGAGGTLVAAAMSLALASQTSVIGAGGLAFAIIVCAAAIVGALSLKLEAIHIAAFAAALIGLFVLSGQPSAAIWFTPVTTWAGALFLAIAALRVPQNGVRGVTLAGTGAMAPLGAIAALHFAGHGLADRFAAAGAFVVLAGLLAALIAAAAMRRERGLATLGLTLWVLALGAWSAVAGAVTFALPAPIAAPMMAALAAGALGLDVRFRHTVWRACAALSALVAAALSLRAAGMALSEAPDWNAWALIVVGLALPALIAGGTAFLAHRLRAALTASINETVSIALGVVTANIALRVACSGGVVLLTPIGFVEACLHVSVWAGAALALATFSKHGATKVRDAASIALSLWAGLVLLLAGAMWLTPYWAARGDGALSLLTRHALGVVAPALLFIALWWVWRAQGRDLRARGALGVGALALAGAVSLALIRADGAPDWAPALGGAAAFATAIAVNFASGVTRRA